MRGFGWLKPPRHVGIREAADAAVEARRLARATSARLDRLEAAHEDLERRVEPLLRPRHETEDTNDLSGREA